MIAKYNCISLGEGSPGEQPPQFLIDELITAVKEGHNQYTKAFGNPLLVNKVAELYGPKLGRKLDPMSEVFVSVGAYYAIVQILMTLVDPKKEEEVVLFEPGFPCYYDHIQFAGGIVKSALLEFKDGKWIFNPENLRSVLNEKTRVLILNNA